MEEVMKSISLRSKMKNPVTNRKPDTSVKVGDYTVQKYGDTYTIGIKTGQKQGPHYGGKGKLN
jgi:hypothetical protein